MKFIRVIFILSLLLIYRGSAEAQLNPLGSMHFHNQYLANPAMAGFGPGLQLNGVFRAQWNNIPGAPTTQAVTAECRMKEKVGFGLNFHNDEAGLFKNTKVAATYAYHLPLNEKSNLSMGLSLGMNIDRLMSEKINDSPNDPSAARFNQRENYIDGDFGIAYTSNNLTIQAAVPNLKQTFKKGDINVVNRSVFFSAVSCRWSLGQGMDKVVLEPKVVYRGVSKHDNLIDAGANVLLANEQLSLMAMYHSSRNATFGLGLNFHELSFLAMYTTGAGPIRSYAIGNFEVGVRYRIKTLISK